MCIDIRIKVSGSHERVHEGKKKNLPFLSWINDSSWERTHCISIKRIKMSWQVLLECMYSAWSTIPFSRCGWIQSSNFCSRTTLVWCRRFLTLESVCRKDMFKMCHDMFKCIKCRGIDSSWWERGSSWRESESQWEWESLITCSSTVTELHSSQKPRMERVKKPLDSHSFKLSPAFPWKQH